jgi:hypothetical protein
MAKVILSKKNKAGAGRQRLTPIIPAISGGSWLKANLG